MKFEAEKNLLKFIFVSFLALATAGCVHRIVIAAVCALVEPDSYKELEHYSLERCDAVTASAMAAEERGGGDRGVRVWNEDDASRTEVNYTVTYKSTPLHFGTNVVCVSVTSEGDSDIKITNVYSGNILCRHKAGNAIILQCAAVFGEGECERLLVVKSHRTYYNKSLIHVFDKSFNCVWEYEVNGRSWRAVSSENFPNAAFLRKWHPNDNADFYRITSVPGSPDTKSH